MRNTALYNSSHKHFFEPNDSIQHLYEIARRYAFDKRVHIPETLLLKLRAYGVAGLFIDPEKALQSFSRKPRTGPRTGTAFYHSHLNQTVFERVACSLAEGVGIRRTSRIMNVDKKTVGLILTKAANHAKLISSFLLKNLIVCECQLDEMWTFVYKKENNLDYNERLLNNKGDTWIWIAIDPVSKVILSYLVGKRTTEYAVSLIEDVRRITAKTPGIFISDQLDQYKQALLRVYGIDYLPPRKPGAGRPPNSKLIPPDDLLYAQVVKKYKKNSLDSIKRKVVFGDPQKVQDILQKSTSSNTINTSFIERFNATIRNMNARCSRKTYRFSKLLINHVKQLDLNIAYYHFCLPHGTLTGKYKQPTTPFMAIGITDHVWTIRELLETKLIIQ